MGSIQGLGHAASAWSQCSNQRAARPSGTDGTDGASFQDKLFSKLDSDGSGGVDSSELQGLLDTLSSRLGTTVGGSDAFSTMDGNGDGNLDRTELDSGLKSALAGVADTLSFARARGPSGTEAGPPRGAPPPGPPPGPPPDGDGSDAGNTASSTTGTGDAGGSSAVDPLDTNGDGTVSAQERLAGQFQDTLKALATVADSDGDGSVSSDEARRLGDLMARLVQSGDGAASTQGGRTSGDGQPRQRGDSIAALADRVLQHYALANSATSGVDLAA